MANFIEKTIAVLSPSWAANRAKQKHIFNMYEAASSTRTHKATRSQTSANKNVEQGALSLREQARALDENHDIVIGILDKLEERVVGSKGIHVEPQPLNLDGSINEDLAKEIRRKWAEWSISPEVTGRFTRPYLERMLLRTWLRDGEVFLQLVKGKVAGLTHSTDVAFSVEALEPDFVPLKGAEGGEQTVQGVYLDKWQKPTAYQVFISNPQDASGGQAPVKKVDAQNMLHLKFIRRLHQVRGVSLLHGVIVRLADLKDYEESERVAARISAALTMYIKKGDPQSYGDDDDFGESNASDRNFDIAPGAVIDDLKPGEDIGMINSNRPNTNLTTFRNGQLQAVASGTRSSYSSIARDYNGTYSAQRQELVESFEGYACLQDAFIAQITRPMYRAWLEMAIASRVIQVPPGMDENALFNAVYSGPTMPWIDPLKEANSWVARIRGGLATEGQAIRASGNNPAEVKRQRIVEINENAENNLIFDSDYRNEKGIADEQNKETDA